MRIINPLAQRQDAAGAVDRHIALHPQRDRIDKNSPGFRLSETRIGKHNARGLAQRRRRTHRQQPQIALGRFFGHRNLGAERLRSPVGKAMQRVVIEPVFQLRRRHVQRTGQGSDKDKRSDKQTNIKMEATQQVQPCRARGAGCHTFPFLKQKRSLRGAQIDFY